jgi:hypothetical protein
VRQNQSLHFFHFHLSLFIQTLTRLDLSENQIGDKGAQYLGEALKKNNYLNALMFHYIHIRKWKRLAERQNNKKTNTKTGNSI